MFNFILGALAMTLFAIIWPEPFTKFKNWVISLKDRDFK